MCVYMCVHMCVRACMHAYVRVFGRGEKREKGQAQLKKRDRLVEKQPESENWDLMPGLWLHKLKGVGNRRRTGTNGACGKL